MTLCFTIDTTCDIKLDWSKVLTTDIVLPFTAFYGMSSRRVPEHKENAKDDGDDLGPTHIDVSPFRKFPGETINNQLVYLLYGLRPSSYAKS